METLLTTENLMMLLPLLVIEIGLIIFCIYKIFTEGVVNLNKWAWTGIVIAGNLLGTILFLLIGRRRDI